MRDCANCFHRKPVLKEDGTWTAECEKWDCEFQSRENMIEKTKAMNNDLISRSALKEKAFITQQCNGCEIESIAVVSVGAIDNAPTVEAFTKDDMAGAYNEGYACGSRESERPKGEWIADTSHCYDDDEDTFECSVCKEPFTLICGTPKDNLYNFCPNCGADMRGEKE